MRYADTGRKWTELRDLLLDTSAMFDHAGQRRKILVFAEHRDTLNYLTGKIKMLLGRDDIVDAIQGGVRREDRRAVQDRFRQDPTLAVLVATDAAGEGPNLQRAHLMVNYDLPWNPNRIEQRFGRIHRIGQTEVCQLWNLVATETREGDVFARLLAKVEQQRLGHDRHFTAGIASGRARHFPGQQRRIRDQRHMYSGRHRRNGHLTDSSIEPD